MITPYEPTDLHLDLGAYALDALDPTATASFEGHLADCESCTIELLGMTETAGLLAASQQIPPRAHLRSNVLAAIAITPQLAPMPATAMTQMPACSSAAPATLDLRGGIAAATPGIADTSDAHTAAESTSNVIPMTRRRLPFATRMLAVAATVLAVAAGGLGWRNVTLANNLQQVKVASAQVTNVLTAADAKTTTAPIQGGGSAAVVSSASLNKAVVVASEMTPAPSGHVYQLWFMSASGDATPAGFMDPDATGRDTEVLAGSLNSAAVVGITVEPKGGSAGPTTTPVLVVHV
jgi:anti-sigma-K factor RskA